MTAPIGQRRWTVPGGFMPLGGHGREPDFTSHDKLSVLNASDSEAAIEVWVHVEDAEPVGPFRWRVGARRMRAVRFNDMIDPRALPLDTPYAAVIVSSVPVVVQFSRLDSRSAANAQIGALAFPDPGSNPDARP